MKLTSPFRLRDLDLPHVESPYRARERVRQRARAPANDLWMLGVNLNLASPEGQRGYRRLLEQVGDGRLVLVEDHPRSPIVEWDGSRWVKAPGVLPFHYESLLERQLPRLNARGLGPAEVRQARYPAWAVSRPASPPEPPREPAPSPPPAPEPPRERILEIGVFFDGTGNNRENDRRRTDRDITNVAKLFDLYLEDEDQGYHRVYAHGVGTVTGDEGADRLAALRNLSGLALGVGPEGGHARIELALDQLRTFLRGNEGATVILDVFGFSRGAALARHFVNLIHRWPETLPVPDFRPGLPTPRVPLRRIEAFPPGFVPFPQVRFVGLFDTVGSFYLPGDARNLDFNLHLAPGSAMRVVQLTAHHEIRRNFPLSSLADPRGNLPGGFSEIVLPGVHSDVGGGYENPEVDFANHEELLVRRRAGLGSNGRTIRLAQEEAAARGLELRVEPPDVLEIERRATRKELAILALHQMHPLALQLGVPLRGLDEAEPDHALPAELKNAWETWQRAGARLEDARSYLHGYIHTSHRQESLPHAPEASGVRRVFANRPRSVFDKAREVQDA
ncbi:phospholipase effector Tle1 domain-containing protein [Halomonas sp. C05BenzN]|uniref:phospholipase effector Tle1 domain-containing protein n=1 Tax=Halomonas sp. C05BenzN TaxID=3411041 RepID=UPI003B93B480